MTDTEMQRSDQTTFTAVLFVAMGVGLMSPVAVAVLAEFVIEDLGISVAQFGIVIAVINVSGAVLSPIVGRTTDRIGGRRALIMLMVAATVAYAIFGFAFAYVILLIGAVAAGYAQASANPSTNKLIAEALPAGRRGVVTGIKQSGVQAFIFLAAVSLPSLALAIGWRGALLVVALIPLAFIVITPRLIRPTSRDGAAAVVEHRGRLPAAIWWLTTYAFLMGFSGAVTFLVPLFASESLGFDPRVAGFVAGVIAIVGFAARIVWSRIAEFRSAYIGMLGVLGLVSVAASVAFWLSSQGAAWLVWVAAVLVGLGSSSWNGVGMLAVMANAGTAATGRASGFVLFGFMAGLGLAPPLFGRIVDATGGYDPIWVLSGISAFLSTVVAVGWKATSR